MKKILFAFSMIALLFAACKENDIVPIPDDPEANVSPLTIDFGNIQPGETSQADTITIKAYDLIGNMDVTIPANFVAALDIDGVYSNDQLTIDKDLLVDGTEVLLFIKVVAPSDFSGLLTGKVSLATEGADVIEVSLTATVAIEITGSLFISDFFTEYANYSVFLPLDSAIYGWDQNTSMIVSGNGFPEANDIPNNEVYSHWWSPIPNGCATVRGTLGLSESTNMNVTGYPVAPAGAKSVILDPGDGSGGWNFVNRNTGNCAKGQFSSEGLPIGNTAVGRRFAEDGYTGNLFMSALVNVETLGSVFAWKVDSAGMGDIMALANATSGPSNNNTVKIVALPNGNPDGKFQFGLLKENEGNPTIYSQTIFDLNTTYVVILSHEFVAGDNNDISKLYVFKEGDEIPLDVTDATPEVIMDDTYTYGVDPSHLSIVYLRERRQSNFGPKAEITGIRVGDTWRATLFENESNAVHSNTIDHSKRIVTNIYSDCTP